MLKSKPCMLNVVRIMVFLNINLVGYITNIYIMYTFEGLLASSHHFTLINTVIGNLDDEQPLRACRP